MWMPEHDEIKLQKIINRRIINIEKMSYFFNVICDKDTIKLLLIDKIKEHGLWCKYCNKRLSLQPQFPYFDALSIDHYKPLCMEGTNQKENLIVCCNRCNMIKGTLDGELFEKLIKILKNDSDYEKMMNGMFFGRRADKIASLQIENNQNKCLICGKILENKPSYKKWHKDCIDEIIIDEIGLDGFQHLLTLKNEVTDND